MKWVIQLFLTVFNKLVIRFKLLTNFDLNNLLRKVKRKKGSTFEKLIEMNEI